MSLFALIVLCFLLWMFWRTITAFVVCLAVVAAFMLLFGGEPDSPVSVVNTTEKTVRIIRDEDRAWITDHRRIR